MANCNHMYHAYVTHLQADHRKVHEAMRALEQHWDNLEATSSSGNAYRLLRQLECLRRDLEEHFREEEAGGCLEEAVSRSPGLSRALNQVEQEHGELLAKLDQLIMRVEAADVDETASLRRLFAAFAERLQAHEAHENEIVERGFGIEVDE